MKLTLLILALAPGDAPASSSARSAWESCLQSSAQVESLGSGSDVTVAVKALSTCSTNKDRYVKALIRGAIGTSPGGQSPASQALQQVTLDQRELTIRLIAFIRKLRQQP
ncbi:hypothetical protein HMP09_1251 [Sphingomonas sp. HMP9]|nr:hypothetical protein HMP09_1251 [Sphingomonas sp. HMP9]